MGKRAPKSQVFKAHWGVARWLRHGMATLAGLGEPPHSQVPAPGRPNCSLQLHSSSLLSGLGGHVILPPPIPLLMWFQGCCCQCHLLSIWAMSSMTAVTIRGSWDTGKDLGILRGYSYVRDHFCVTSLVTISFTYVPICSVFNAWDACEKEMKPGRSHSCQILLPGCCCLLGKGLSHFLCARTTQKAC